MQVKDSVFIVSGGGSGLGAATATLLVESGARVVIADINQEAGFGLSRSLDRVRTRFSPMDVTGEETIKGTIELALKEFGRIDGVVNCAGIGLGEKTLGKDGPHSLTSFTRVVMVNLIGTFNVIRLVSAAIATQEATPGGERGVIVNTASIAAFDGQIGQAAYSASKGGIVGMTLPIARDLARVGIRVVTIAPGIFDTPLLGSLPENVRQALGAQVPFPPRLGRPAEYAALAKHIIENEMLNGEVIRLDGALRMPPK